MTSRAVSAPKLKTKPRIGPPESFAGAVKEAISEASKTVRGMNWFEVTSPRERITKDKVECFQAVVKIGFKVER